jgi:hypothetical protein
MHGNLYHFSVLAFPIALVCGGVIAKGACAVDRPISGGRSNAKRVRR